MQRSRNKLGKSVLSFSLFVGSRDQTQVVRFAWQVTLRAEHLTCFSVFVFVCFVFPPQNLRSVLLPTRFLDGFGQWVPESDLV